MSNVIDFAKYAAGIAEKAATTNTPVRRMSPDEWLAEHCPEYAVGITEEAVGTAEFDCNEWETP